MINYTYLEKKNNCLYDINAKHEYSIFECPECSVALCWNCSVRVTDDSKGSGTFTCPDCGYTEEYPFI